MQALSKTTLICNIYYKTAFESVNEIRSIYPEVEDSNLDQLERIKPIKGELFIESVIPNHFLIINKDEYSIVD